ncbi:MAG: RNA polymerase sigma factor [Candidatus Dojkabacteria bacterium]
MTNAKIQNLVKQAQMGEKEALAKLYNLFFDQIYYFVYSRVNSVHETQEIVSDVFLSMVEGIHKFKGQSSFKNYMFGITKNKIRDYIKNKYKAGSYVLQSNLDENLFENITVEEVDTSYRNRLRKVLGKVYNVMKPRYAKVLDLRYNQMNTVGETAQKLGISENNVKVIQHRAIKEAKNIWENLDEKERKKYFN